MSANTKMSSRSGKDKAHAKSRSRKLETLKSVEPGAEMQSDDVLTARAGVVSSDALIANDEVGLKINVLEPALAVMGDKLPTSLKTGQKKKTQARKTRGSASAATSKPSPQTEIAPMAVVSGMDTSVAAASTPVPAPVPTRVIHQIYFLPEQLAGLDSAFVPFDNGASTDLLREFTVFERLAEQHAADLVPLWGAMSWRFLEKTGMTGEDLLRKIDEKPGHDLYYCNPFPENEAIFLNGWQQGSISHPALIELSAAIFAAAELDKRDLHSIQPSAAFSTCNYFVGTARFWNSYVPWVRSIIDAARAKLPEAVVQVLDSALSDPANRHVSSSYWPFFIERLIPLFLRKMGRELKVCKLSVVQSEAKLNAHLQRLREMKDMACKTRSRWLYGCWLSYRNLYLQHVQGREWCQRHLPALTNTEAEFW